MSVFITFAVLGLGLGGLYALTGLGLVLVYRASRTINFSQGAMGMVGTYLFWWLHDRHGWNYYLAFVIGLVACALLGAIAYLLALRPLRIRGASPITRLLATLGILATLQASVSLLFPAQEQIVTGGLPNRGVRFLGTTVNEAELWIFVIALALSVLLRLAYRTRFGLATTAVAENPIAAAAMGHSPDLIAAGNWAVGAVLSGLSGILLAPTTGLSVTEFTELLIPSLAAAAVGAMTSFPITFLAAVGIGIAQSELTHYASGTAGLPEVVPFFVVLAYALIRGTGLPTRGEGPGRMPAVGTGRVRPVGLVLVVAAALVIIYTSTDNWVAGVTVTIVIAIVVLSVVVVTGYAGQLSLCQFALAGTGAFIAGRLFAAQGWPFPAALAAALAAAIPIGVTVGLPSVRVRGPYLAVTTLCLAVALENFLFDSAKFTGGDVGSVVTNLTFFGLDVNPALHPRSYAVLVLAFAVVAGLLIANLRRSRTGRSMIAVRSNERAAAALGISVVGMKLRAFVVGSVLAALGGVLFAFLNSVIVYSTFTWLQSVTITGFGIIGGMGFAAGPYFGALFQPGSLSTNVGNEFGASIQTYLLLAGGVFLIATVIQSPDGVAARSAKDIGRLIRLGERFLRRSQPTAATGVDGPDGLGGLDGLDRVEAAEQLVGPTGQPAEPASYLEVERISLSFGGSRALNDVSARFEAGVVTAIVGPNGAGKTSLLEVMMGFVNSQQGRVRLNGRDITRLSVEARASLGLGLTFQSLELFEDMTVLENLQVGAEAGKARPMIFDLVRPAAAKLTAEMRATIVAFDLQDVLAVAVKDLPYGRRRLVAVARAVVRGSAILFLDEPAAGLSTPERAELGRMINALAGRGVAVVVVEHDVEFVSQHCDQVIVLDFGQVIGSGPPEQVLQSEAVVRAYLGVEDAVEPVSAR
jgi:ABC-type branched-subunit amino acid transport system ATPase component/branched-subunit amino acid ABC-type transport system permease component